jgi:hypothetical protein
MTDTPPTTMETANKLIRELRQILIGKNHEIEELQAFIDTQMKKGEPE